MARSVPKRPTIQVLITPDVALLQWSDENWLMTLFGDFTEAGKIRQYGFTITFAL